MLTLILAALPAFSQDPVKVTMANLFKDQTVTARGFSMIGTYSYDGVSFEFKDPSYGRNSCHYYNDGHAQLSNGASVAITISNAEYKISKVEFTLDAANAATTVNVNGEDCAVGSGTFVWSGTPAESVKLVSSGTWFKFTAITIT